MNKTVLRVCVSLLFACLIVGGLTACNIQIDKNNSGNTSQTVQAGIPSFTPLEKLSAPADVSVGKKIPEDIVLPTDVIGLNGWVLQESMNPVALLAKSGDLALYGVCDDGEFNCNEKSILQWEDVKAEFDWSYTGPRIVEPKLNLHDVDNDGEDEAVVIIHTGCGTGIHILELHIVEKTGDTLTDYRFPDTLWQDKLSDKLDVWINGEHTFVVLGDELVDVSSHLDGISKDEIHGYNTGYICMFYTNYDHTGNEDIVFRGSAMLDADSIAPTSEYSADIFARVQYKDGIFTLCGMHINSYDNGYAE